MGEKDVVTIGLGDMSHEFNFSIFSRQHREEELPSKDEIIGLASIAVPPSDPLEQYLLVKEICPRGNNKVIIYFLIS